MAVKHRLKPTIAAEGLEKKKKQAEKEEG